MQPLSPQSETPPRRPQQFSSDQPLDTKFNTEIRTRNRASTVSRGQGVVSFAKARALCALRPGLVFRILVIYIVQVAVVNDGTSKHLVFD